MLTSLCLSLVSIPLVDGLQGRIAELTADLAAAKNELTRLQGVEVDLSRTVQSLRSEIISLKKEHSDELAAVATAGGELCAEQDAAVAAQAAMRAELDAAIAARDSLRQDRDEHIAKFEELEKCSYEEATRLRRRAKGFCDTMTEMDVLLSGKSFLHPSAFSDCSPLLLCCSYFPS